MSLIFLILLYLIQITDSHIWFSSLLFQKGLAIISIPNSKGLYLHLIIEGQALRYVLKPTLWKCLEVQKSNLPRSGLGFECFGPKACYMIWHTMFMCLQSSPNFILWTAAAFSGIFAHRSRTVSLGECRCSYLGTPYPSFFAQSRKNKGCIQCCGTTAFAELWEALISVRGLYGCSETPLPCPEQWQHSAWCEPTFPASWLCHLSIMSGQPLDRGSTLPTGPKVLWQKV